MSEWITDRRPTEEDADKDGIVIVFRDGMWRGVYLNQVGVGDPWIPAPKPYQPPEPDMSLSASIERVDKWLADVVEVDVIGDIGYDIDRIIEAARKWDEHISNAAVQAHDDYTPPKPEKVSTLIGIEPKELARLREIERQWDEHECGMESLSVPRRRIGSGDKQQAPVVSSGDTAETQSDSKPDPIWCEWKEVSE